MVFYSFAAKHTPDFLDAVLGLVPVSSNPLHPTCATPMPLSMDIYPGDARKQLCYGNWRIDPRDLTDWSPAFVATKVMLHPGEALYAGPGCDVSGFYSGWTVLESIAVALPDRSRLVAGSSELNPGFRDGWLRFARTSRTAEHPQAMVFHSRTS